METIYRERTDEATRVAYLTRLRPAAAWQKAPRGWLGGFLAEGVEFQTVGYVRTILMKPRSNSARDLSEAGRREDPAVDVDILAHRKPRCSRTFSKTPGRSTKNSLSIRRLP